MRRSCWRARGVVGGRTAGLIEQINPQLFRKFVQLRRVCAHGIAFCLFIAAGLTHY